MLVSVALFVEKGPLGREYNVSNKLRRIGRQGVFRQGDTECKARDGGGFLHGPCVEDDAGVWVCVFLWRGGLGEAWLEHCAC